MRPLPVHEHPATLRLRVADHGLADKSHIWPMKLHDELLEASPLQVTDPLPHLQPGSTVGDDDAAQVGPRV